MAQYEPDSKKGRLSEAGDGVFAPSVGLHKPRRETCLTNIVVLDEILRHIDTRDLLELRLVCSTWAKVMSRRLNQALVLKLKNRGKIGSENHVDVINKFLVYGATRSDFGFAPRTVQLHLSRTEYFPILIEGEWTKAVEDLSVSGFNRNDWLDIMENFIFSFVNLKKLKVTLGKCEVMPLSQFSRLMLERKAENVKNSVDYTWLHGLETFELVHDIGEEFEFPFGFGDTFLNLTNYSLTCHKSGALQVHLTELWATVPVGKIKSLSLKVQRTSNEGDALPASIANVCSELQIEKLNLESRFTLPMTKSLVENLTAPIQHLTLYVSMNRGTSDLGFFEDVLPPLCQGSLADTLKTLDLRIRQDGDWRRQANNELSPLVVDRYHRTVSNSSIKDLRISKASGKQAGRRLAPVPDVFHELYLRIPTLFPNVQTLSVFVPTVKTWRTLMGSCSQMAGLKTLNMYSGLSRKSMSNFVLFGKRPVPFPHNRASFGENYRGICSLVGVENVNVYAPKGLDIRRLNWLRIKKRMRALRRITFKASVLLTPEESRYLYGGNPCAKIVEDDSKFKAVEAGMDEFLTGFCNLKV